MKNTRSIQIKYTDNDYPKPFPSDYYFIHYSICPSNTFLFIYIISECKQIAERDAIRNTWGKIGMNNVGVIIRFIIGIGKKICELNYLLEYKKYSDMLQINIYESFINETLFSLYTMKYLNILCPYCSFYAKFDVDTYVNINMLLKEIKVKEDRSLVFFGAEKQKWKKVNDNQSFKYSSPKFVAKYYNNLFPMNGIDVYSGFATIFSNDIPSLLFNYSLMYPILIRIDDQYISWLLYKLNININAISSYAILPHRCTIHKNVSIIHRITSIDMISYSLYYYY